MELNYKKAELSDIDEIVELKIKQNKDICQQDKIPFEQEEITRESIKKILLQELNKTIHFFIAIDKNENKAVACSGVVIYQMVPSSIFLNGLKSYVNSIIYFLCCNSPLVSIAIQKLKNDNCYIINREYLIKNHLKLDVQRLLAKNKISVPKIYPIESIEEVKFPIFCKENRHEGIIIQMYNKISLTKFFEKFNASEFYLEETIDNNNANLKEFKVYFVKEEIFPKDIMSHNKVIIEMCKKVSLALNNLEVFSADIIQNNDGEYFIIDVNQSAGFYLSDDGRRYFLDKVTKIGV
jgi:glutathione synthase/RimK-type ligase-like ATP-grasp enzyme